MRLINQMSITKEIESQSLLSCAGSRYCVIGADVRYLKTLTRNQCQKTGKFRSSIQKLTHMFVMVTANKFITHKFPS